MTVEQQLTAGIAALGLTLPEGAEAKLLAYLALPPGKARSREEVMALLWSDREEAQARASLRQVLSVTPTASRLVVAACLIPGCAAFARDILIARRRRDA